MVISLKSCIYLYFMVCFAPFLGVGKVYRIISVPMYHFFRIHDVNTHENSLEYVRKTFVGCVDMLD